MLCFNCLERENSVLLGAVTPLPVCRLSSLSSCAIGNAAGVVGGSHMSYSAVRAEMGTAECSFVRGEINLTFGIVVHRMLLFSGEQPCEEHTLQGTVMEVCLLQCWDQHIHWCHGPFCLSLNLKKQRDADCIETQWDPSCWAVHRYWRITLVFISYSIGQMCQKQTQRGWDLCSLWSPGTSERAP